MESNERPTSRWKLTVALIVIVMLVVWNIQTISDHRGGGTKVAYTQQQKTKVITVRRDTLIRKVIVRDSVVYDTLYVTLYKDTVYLPTYKPIFRRKLPEIVMTDTLFTNSGELRRDYHFKLRDKTRIYAGAFAGYQSAGFQINLVRPKVSYSVGYDLINRGVTVGFLFRIY